MFPFFTGSIHTCSKHNYTGTSPCPDCNNSLYRNVTYTNIEDEVKKEAYKEVLKWIQRYKSSTSYHDGGAIQKKDLLTAFRTKFLGEKR